MSEEEKLLIRKRASMKSRLTIFSNFLRDEINRNLTDPRFKLDELLLIDLQSRVERLETLFDEFNDVQNNIEQITDNFEQQLLEREQFENTFFSKMAYAKRVLKNHYETQYSPPGSTHTNAVHNSPASHMSEDNIRNLQSVRLPLIDLPKFSGKYDMWLEFRDTFDSLINSNDTLSPIQKFHYLRASLSDSAAQVIKSLEFSSSNYTVAWSILRERYDNSRLLINKHVHELFNIEPIAKESAVKIRLLIDSLSKHLRSLEQLKQPVDQWDTLIIYLVCQKLDSRTLRQWEESKSEHEVPTLKNLKSFLKDRADLLETLSTDRDHTRENKPKSGFSKNFLASSNICAYCKNDHLIYKCEDFLKLPVSERIEFSKKKNLCLICLKSNHYTKSCRLQKGCTICRYRHNTLLHIDRTKNESPVIAESNINQDSKSADATIALPSNSIQHILLSTAYIQIFDENNVPHTIRALLDSGSQCSFITSDICEKLLLKTQKFDFSVSGLNQRVTKINERCTLKIGSHFTTFQTTIDCFVLPDITGFVPSVKLNFSHLQIPKTMKLADSTFYNPGKIDMLIGADLFWSLLCVGQYKLGPGQPILQKTKFGWVVSGPIPMSQNNSHLCHISTMDIQQQLSKFWELEECLNPQQVLSIEERSCEDHFVKHFKRLSTGRFQVSIPFKNNLGSLGDSFHLAHKRFLSLEKKLQRNPSLKEQYVSCMSEYETMGHMTKVEDFDMNEVAYFIPHHGVVREDSLTTKLRIVFDASAPTTSGLSLNSVQMVGPTIQNDLTSTIIRFRKHAIVLSADIEKMFKQVSVEPSQRRFQRILWRSEPSEPINIFNLNTVTFGMASSPFLAIRSLFQLAIDCENQHPFISNIIKNDFYVDDLLTGANTFEEAVYICDTLSQILNSGNFPLRKWYSNEPRIIKHLKTESLTTDTTIQIGPNECAKTLGLIWSCNSDVLKYNIKSEFVPKRITKRSILSNIGQIFDPLGLLAPCTIIAKLLLQKIWLQKLSWDESLPLDIHTTWSKFRNELHLLNQLSVPRQVLCHNVASLELHSFSDSSQLAYGGCVYIKTINNEGESFVHLVCAKSKVAPLKTVTIPRLELCGALLSSRLAKKVIDSIKLEFDRYVFWTDSTIVLGWIKTAPNLLKTFVSNRVSEIQDITGSYEWRHTPTSSNPADFLSRGVPPSQLKDLQLWWNGPPWLLENESSWPNLTSIIDDLPETRKIESISFPSTCVEKFPFLKFSNLNRLKRVTAQLFRFVFNCSHSRIERKYILLAEDIQDAFEKLIMISQKQSFPNEIMMLEKGKECDSKSSLYNLNPFIDKSGLMRVGGRLDNSSYNFNKKHPIIVCTSHHLTKLIFTSEHIRLLHAGPQLLLASLRERFWPIRGRDLAKQTVRRCIRCFRKNPKTTNPIMGNLPAQRFEVGSVFQVTGVDYAGPFLIKDKKGRGGKVSKCWISLFICFTTKAIHLELVSELTTDSFLKALRRFVSRRGKPSSIFSDNGTTFVGACSKMKELGKFLIENESDIIESVSTESIKWNFIPPNAPHFGGLWEAGVKSIKHHLTRVMGEAHLTFEDFYTLLTQVEAVVNSRPLFLLSSEPSDPLPLTPAHFLIGKPLMSVPDQNFEHVPENRLTQFERIQKLVQHFWNRWNKEYISQLQERVKWKATGEQLKEDQIVIIKEDRLPTLQWRLGRIVTLHPGKDGICRVATVKTKGGNVKRAFNKLCPLPLPSDVPDEHLC